MSQGLPIRTTSGAERGEVGSLVLVALAADELGVRVVAEGLRQLVEGDGDLERGQVRAGEKRRQVGRREAQPATVVNAHLPESCVVRRRSYELTPWPWRTSGSSGAPLCRRWSWSSAWRRRLAGWGESCGSGCREARRREPPDARPVHGCSSPEWPQFGRWSSRGTGSAQEVRDRRDRLDGRANLRAPPGHALSTPGYQVEHVGRRGDYGADLIVRWNGERIVVQAKGWTKNVGIKAVQEANAAPAFYRCSNAMVVTNRYFTRRRRNSRAQTGVVLWDRDRLVKALLAVRDS